MRLFLPRRRLGLLALLPLSVQAAQLGPWQGHWRVLRDDPRIRSRAHAMLLRLAITQEADSDTADIRWIAERAICPDPLAPCAWVGAHGSARGVRRGRSWPMRGSFPACWTFPRARRPPAASC